MRGMGPYLCGVVESPRRHAQERRTLEEQVATLQEQVNGLVGDATKHAEAAEAAQHALQALRAETQQAAQAASDAAVRDVSVQNSQTKATSNHSHSCGRRSTSKRRSWCSATTAVRPCKRRLLPCRYNALRHVFHDVVYHT